MRVLPVSTKVPSRVVSAGASLAFAVAYSLFILMFLVMLGDTVLTIYRSW
jgi:hypothetical protein